MTHYGLNPSFLYASPLPLLSRLIGRARRFEVFDDAGRPTGVESPLGPDGWPVEDGRRHGVRLFGAPPFPEIRVPPSVRVTQTENMLCVHWTVNPRLGTIRGVHELVGWDAQSLRALQSLLPSPSSVLRTLDLQMTNKRQDWSKPRVRPDDPIQGSDRGMAVELQAKLANMLQCHLWWPAPPRFELPVAEYEARLEEMLVAIKDTAKRPPVLEYGNELWNGGFAIHNWLQRESFFNGRLWQQTAADEIATLKRVAYRVFGTPGPLGGKPYYLFVGGQLTVPSHLDRILDALADLGVVPDLAGPALYVTPLKASVEEWEAADAVPTQEELRASCFARLEEIKRAAHRDPGGVDGPLAAHGRIVGQHGVPFFACYEAGQSLIARGENGQPTAWRRAAIEAQGTEWMGELYRGIRRAAEQAGVDLLCWYSAATDQTPTDPRVDVFGLLESTDLTKRLPKALAARGD